MSSVLEFGTEDAVFQEPNPSNGSGLFIITDSQGPNFISIEEVGNDLVFGSNVNDNILTGEGDDVINGGDGNDFLDGDNGNDIIKGETGNDIINGGTGRDILAGGEGQDIFIFELEDFQDGELDTIQDFEQGVDSFQFGSDVDTDLITVEGNLVKYDGEAVIEIQGDEPDLEIF